MARGDIGTRPDHKEISAKGGRNSGPGQRRAAKKRHDIKTGLLILRDTPLPEERKADFPGCETYGDAWGYAISEKVLSGDGGCVEAIKFIANAMGEDVNDKTEVVIKIDAETDSIFG